MSLPSSKAAEPKSTALVAGEVVADRYKIDRLLGEGGMGAVYRAEHIHMRKIVALKVLHAEVSNHEEIVARFEREAVVAANIEHANVVAATDFGRLASGSFFLVLEYIDGRSLRDELGPKKPLPPARALAILRGIVAGVRAAHQKGIVHRDLKPENVMLTERGPDRDFVKVLDFGIAKLAPTAGADKPSGVQALTRIGMIYGTPDYMSPEQALGEEVDARTDLYAIGVIAYEMLTGAAPWAGGAMTQLRERLLAETAPAIPAPIAETIDPRVLEIVKKLLARDKDARFQSADEVEHALDALATDARQSDRSIAIVSSSSPNLPVTGTAKTQHAVPSPIDTLVGSPRRMVLAGAAAFVVVIAVVAIALVSSSSPGPTTRTAESASADPAASAPTTVTAPPLASLEPDPDPTPSASASAAAPSRPGAGRGRRPTKPPAGRKEGPGGIYIPPPDTWFK